MKTNPPSHLRARLVAVLAFLTFALSLGQAQAYDRIFNLTLTNGLNVPVTWTIHPGSCYEGTGVLYPGGVVHGPVAPGGSVTLVMARVQGHGCDGKQGKFQIESSFTYPDIPEGSHGWQWQPFDFSNDGDLRETYFPNGYSGELTATVTGNRKDYVWTMKDISHRLSGPLDARLTMPRNEVARNVGKWDGGGEDGGGILVNELTFRKNGHQGMTYSQCTDIPMFHAQHVVRLPNKDGRAYFAVTNSWAETVWWPGAPGRPRGNMVIYRSDSLDPVTDLVPNNPGTDGEIVYEAQYGWNVDQKVPYNRVGSWNHPCKMEVCGGVLIVCMLDWDGNDLCRDGSKMANQNTLAFYDVRDPANPKFWGRMSKTELGVNKIENANLAYIGGKWVLMVEYKWWYSDRVSPMLKDWVFGGWVSTGAMQGDILNSYERYDLPGETAPAGTTAPGTERLIFGNGDGEDEDNEVAGDQYLSFEQAYFDDDQTVAGFSPKGLGIGTGGWSWKPKDYRTAPNLWTIPGDWINPVGPNSDKKDYDACGVSVRKGMPVIYSPLLFYNNHGFGDTFYGDGGNSGADVLYQIYHPANFALRRLRRPEWSPRTL